MDKNTVIGFTLIAIILIGFGYLNRPSQEEIEQRQRYNDSIAAVQAAEEAKIIAAEEAHNQALLLQQTAYLPKTFLQLKKVVLAMLAVTLLELTFAT